MRSVFVCVLQLCALVVFLGACWIAASDAQGAIVFLLALPSAAALLAVSSFMAGEGSWLRYGAYGMLAYLCLFMVGAFVPALRFLASGPMNAVEFLSIRVTGQTPYQRAHAKHDVTSLLKAELVRTRKGEIDFANIRTGWDWDRVCIFGPYTSNEAAAKTLGFAGWDMERYSQIAISDSVQMFAFVDSKEQVVRYSAEISRNLGDFSGHSRECFGKVEVKALAANASPSPHPAGP